MISSKSGDQSLDLASVLVLLFHLPGASGRKDEPVNGRTRLQKLVFLAYEEGGLKKQLAPAPNYIPYKAGPFSSDVIDILEFLRQMNVVRDYGALDDEAENQEFALTANGQSIAQKVEAVADERLLKSIETVKVRYNGLPLTELIKYVYAKYPNFAVRSRVRL